MVQLAVLSVAYCDVLMDIEGGEEDITIDEIVFSKMRNLQLINLPSLTSFCSARYTFKFPCLEEVTVEGCPNLRNFCPGVLITPKLHNVAVERYKSECCWEGDLNATIQHLHVNMVNNVSG